MGETWLWQCPLDTVQLQIVTLPELIGQRLVKAAVKQHRCMADLSVFFQVDIDSYHHVENNQILPLLVCRFQS